MLLPALEIITQAVSNSLFMFCFCNLIIIMIFLGSKPLVSLDQESCTPLPVPSTTSHTKEAEETGNGILTKQHDSNLVVDLSAASCDGDVGSEDKKEMIAHDVEDVESNEEREDEEEEEAESDEAAELRRRVEEFIAKVNKQWREEKLRRLLNSDVS